MIVGVIACCGLFVPDISTVAVVLASAAADAGDDATRLLIPDCVCVIGTEVVVPVASGGFGWTLEEIPTPLSETPTMATSLLSAVFVVVSSFSTLIRLLAG